MYTDESTPPPAIVGLGPISTLHLGLLERSTAYDLKLRLRLYWRFLVLKLHNHDILSFLQSIKCVPILMTNT